MSKPTPGHVGNVKQSIHSAQVDERAEVRQIFHGAVDGVANGYAFEEFLSLLAALLLDQFAPAEHDVFPVVVNFDDFEIVSVADKLLQIFRWNDVDLRSRQKCFDADVHHESAFDDGFHFALDQSIAGKNAGDLVPVLTIGGLFLRKHDHAFIILETLEQYFHFVAYFHRCHVLELRRWNNALGFITDIDQHLAGANFQNPPFDDASFLKVAHRLRE